MKYPKLRLVFAVTVIITLLGMVPAAAASTGKGIIVEGNPVGTEKIGPLNPLLCNNPNCRRITDFLFPTLYAVDPQTGLVTAAADGNFGLAVDTAAPTGDTSVIQLRDNLVWSDGEPVTAYDVLYSYLAITSGYLDTPYAYLGSTVQAARVIDDHRIKFAYREANCSTPARMNFPIVPSHVFDPNFKTIVDKTLANDDLKEWYKAWFGIYPRSNFDFMNSNAFNLTPNVTAGEFRFAERLPGEEIRLQTPDGALAFIYRDVKAGMDETQFFRSGGSNVLVNPPLETRDDLLADPELKVTQTPGSTWNYIAMNVANPGLPRSAVDGNGKALEQGNHPVFGDIRVRQAIQKAINVNELIDTALLGYGLPILSSRIPGTWASNDRLPPNDYDPDGAQQLLSEAGWVDYNADGVRECGGCLYASQGRSLTFSLLVASDDGRELAANLISRQLRELGISVDVNVMDEGSLRDQVRYQQFDAYMDGQVQAFPTDADQTTMFTRTGDVLYGGGNFGSYTNPEIEKLMSKALTLSGCDMNARSEIYQQIQGILQADQPFIWLYSAQDMVVTRDIVGAAPYPNQPFWNIQDWIVAS